MDSPSRILITTDAWHPQVNGVVRTLDTTARILRSWGHIVEVLSPATFSQVPVPFYPEIALSLARPGQIDRLIQSFRPDHIHISTEGPIGLWTRRYCLMRKLRFCTCYHTKFPEYLSTLAHVPERWTYRVLRWFHNRASRVQVATPSLERDLIKHGFTAPIGRWSRGVDLSLFHPRPKQPSPWPRPHLLYVGRVSKEKGIEDFLRLETPGTKIVVGDGPARQELESRHPQAKFLGYRKGEALAQCYADADLFVFPSRTDTFGLVMIEAMASGLPVAAYPVTGPIDIVTNRDLGSLHEDLSQAIQTALREGKPEACVAEGQRYTWTNSTQQFLNNLVPV